MSIDTENPLYALIQHVEINENILAEAQRKAKIKEQIARAMDRANHEWR